MAVAAYAVSSIDLIPVLGYVDDIIIVLPGILLVVKLIPPEIMNEHRETADKASETPGKPNSCWRVYRHLDRFRNLPGKSVPVNISNRKAAGTPCLISARKNISTQWLDRESSPQGVSMANNEGGINVRSQS